MESDRHLSVKDLRWEGPQRPESEPDTQIRGTEAAPTFKIRVGDVCYQALVASGLLDAVGSTISKTISGPRCAVITDTNVGALLGDRVQRSLIAANFQPTLITIPAGEQSKTLEQAGAICDQMMAAGLDRQSFVIGLGGGVIGDISGFVAAIFLRGIPHVQIPTTLLAMVDSSIGGKTGVNTRDGKTYSEQFIIPRS